MENAQCEELHVSGPIEYHGWGVCVKTMFSMGRYL